VNKVNEFSHVPVARDRCINLLGSNLSNLKNLDGSPMTTSPVIVDATVGLGGHSEALLATYPNIHLVGFDRDEKALSMAAHRLAPYQSRMSLIHDRFDEFNSHLEKLANKGEIASPMIAGALFDLGVSSMQLDDASRGFSYAQSGPIDMRMNQGSEFSAQTILDTYSREKLIKILRQYSDEKFAPKIADRIIEARTQGTLTSTEQLADLVKESIPAPARRTGGNPAKRTFQALRIEVNSELVAIESAIPQALESLLIGGRVVAMSYQSLEDKLVKSAFSKVTDRPYLRGLPIEIDSEKPSYQLLTRQSEGASEEEIAQNSRAQSMRLRAIERVAA
jgi:16S rRNA (cytosine1402-N4)-methyltransferase